MRRRGSKRRRTFPEISPETLLVPDFRAQLQADLSGTFSFERELGGGGMSRVFLATETALGRRVDSNSRCADARAYAIA